MDLPISLLAVVPYHLVLVHITWRRSHWITWWWSCHISWRWSHITFWWRSHWVTWWRSCHISWRWSHITFWWRSHWITWRWPCHISWWRPTFSWRRSSHITWRWSHHVSHTAFMRMSCWVLIFATWEFTTGWTFVHKCTKVIRHRRHVSSHICAVHIRRHICHMMI